MIQSRTLMPMLILAVVPIRASRANDLDRSERLLALANARFGEDLTDADRKLFRDVAHGKPADFRSNVVSENDPATCEAWGKERIVQGDRIRWMCADAGARREVPLDEGIRIEFARIDGPVELSGCGFDGPLVFDGCCLNDDIRLDRARLASLRMKDTRAKSVYAPRLDALHGVYFVEGFKADGEVNLQGATIGGDLSFRNATVACTDASDNRCWHDAIVADGIRVEGSVQLNDAFAAIGTVRLLNARIDGNLECVGATLQNVLNDALVADGIDVKGSVFVSGNVVASTNVTGPVSFAGARVKGQFVWLDVGVLGNAVDPQGNYQGVESLLNLDGARVGTLWDEPESWPSTIRLDGFKYDRIKDLPNLAARLSWLDLQPKDGLYRPQPYVQLAGVLHQMGYEDEAREVLLAKVNDPRRLASLGSWWRRAFHYILRYTIGNGYYPERALWWILGFLLAGTFIFGWADRSNFMVATKGDTTAKVAFNQLVYSLDAFVPLIDLHQVKHRLPAAGWVRAYFWLHILAGWSEDVP